MADAALVRAALEKALKALGPDKLSTRLNSPPELIQTWINGHATMPGRKLTMLMNVMAELDDLNDPRP
jgi:hypothetical protein